MGKLPHMGQSCVRCFDGDAHLYPLGMVQGLDKQRTWQEKLGDGLIVDTFHRGMHDGHGAVLGGLCP